MQMPQSVLRSTNGHSSTVQMRLHINGQSLPVVQAGDDAIKLRDEAVLAEGPATLEIVIDGRSRHSAINIVANTDSRWIQITRQT